MNVYSVISLPKTMYTPYIYMVLANPNDTKCQAHLRRAAMLQQRGERVVMPPGVQMKVHHSNVRHRQKSGISAGAWPSASLTHIMISLTHMLISLTRTLISLTRTLTSSTHMLISLTRALTSLVPLVLLGNCIPPPHEILMLHQKTHQHATLVLGVTRCLQHVATAAAVAAAAAAAAGIADIKSNAAAAAAAIFHHKRTIMGTETTRIRNKAHTHAAAQEFVQTL